MADFDPNDHTAHSTSPAARLATRDELYGPSSPAAPLSADELAEMRRTINAATPGDWYRNGEYVRDATAGDALLCLLNGRLEDVTFAASAKASMRRLLSALEALTAENARLTSERDMLSDAAEEGGGIVLTEEGRQRFFDAIMNPKPPSPRMIAAYQRYKQWMGRDHDWYTLHRRRVEAAHAAAKEGVE